MSQVQPRDPHLYFHLNYLGRLAGLLVRLRGEGKALLVVHLLLPWLLALPQDVLLHLFAMLLLLLVGLFVLPLRNLR